MLLKHRKNHNRPRPRRQARSVADVLRLIEQAHERDRTGAYAHPDDRGRQVRDGKILIRLPGRPSRWREVEP